MGHPGRDRTLRLIRDIFFWPGMSVDVEEFTAKCERCQRRKSKINNTAPLESIVTTYPLELVCMDFLTLEPSKGGIHNILVITDHFTKFAVAVPTKNQTARTTAEALVNHFIFNYGIPTRFHSDQGANFESELMKELCTLMNIQKSRTTPYHPMGNAIPERFNRTLLNMLGTLENKQKENWKKFVTALVYAYNCTPHESTRFSPFELMFGRPGKLPIDSLFESIEETKNTTTNDYIKELKENMKTSQEIVAKNLHQARQKQAFYYNKKAKAAKVYIGDKVLVKVVRFDGKHKIADKFEEELYEVIGQPVDNVPVFRLKSTVRNIIKTLHRNLIFPVKHHETEETTATTRKEEIVLKSDASVESSSESESEDDTVYVVDAWNNGDAHLSEPDRETEGDEEAESEESKTEADMESEMESEEEQGVSDNTDVSSEAEEETDEDTTDNATGAVNDTVEDEDTTEVKTDTPAVKMQTTPRPTPRKFLHEPHPAPRPPPRPPNITTGTTPEPPPKRPTRERKLPARFDSYQMYQMQSRPVDSKIQSINVIMSSGILNEIDRDVAHKVLKAILQ